MTYFDSINLFESGAKLLGTFVDGIKSMAGSLYSSVADALTSVRNLLLFPDAKEGPLSTLTLSGTRMMTTLAGGVTAGASSLLGSVTGVLSGVGKTLGGWWDGVIGGIATGKVPQPVPEASSRRCHNAPRCNANSSRCNARSNINSNAICNSYRSPAVFSKALKFQEMLLAA